MTDIIIACILFLAGLGLLVVSILSFLEKGFLFNNAYIYASKEERVKMDKKPHYRQTAVVFLMMAITFLLLGIMTLTDVFWLRYVVFGMGILAVIYAIISSIRMETKKYV